MSKIFKIFHIDEKNIKKIYVFDGSNELEVFSKSNMRNYCVCRSQNVFFIREKNIGTFSFNQYFASGTKILVFSTFSKRADTLNIFPDNSE